MPSPSVERTHNGGRAEHDDVVAMLDEVAAGQALHLLVMTSFVPYEGTRSVSPSRTEWWASKPEAKPRTARYDMRRANA